MCVPKRRSLPINIPGWKSKRISSESCRAFVPATQSDYRATAGMPVRRYHLARSWLTGSRCYFRQIHRMSWLTGPLDSYEPEYSPCSTYLLACIAAAPPALRIDWRVKKWFRWEKGLFLSRFSTYLPDNERHSVAILCNGKVTKNSDINRFQSKCLLSFCRSRVYEKGELWTGSYIPFEPAEGWFS